jgi:hypothetical protein
MELEFGLDDEADLSDEADSDTEMQDEARVA